MTHRDFATRAIDHPVRGAPATGDVVPPIHLSTAFEMDDPGAPGQGYKYSRFGNPTRDTLEATLAGLEGADHALALSSGMAAISTVCFSTLSPGDHVVAFESLFGGTKALFDDLLAPMDVDVSYVDATDPSNVAAAATADTELVWAESPTNPLLRLCDIEAIAAIADEYDARFAVDNTFNTPYVQRPLELGADVVVYSTTKFLNGHSDATGGAVVTDHETWMEHARFVGAKAFGAVMAPFDCYLVQRGLKTLPLRMDQHQANAQAVAEFLADHSEIEHVYYPGLESHPQHDLANEQMDGYGGVVSFEVAGDAAVAKAFLEELDVFNLAVSLGGVESLVEHTASMSAGNLSAEEREWAGISESLVRAPIGVEDVDDLLDDLATALEKL
ncbi:trans-sulfuration enzyme family protein [Halospeciosus flavus]|uniref:Trans-sulfuration enzyme family protein n=1 Tax=Halospeciosus flavus TaxID=3032283 RepID=A0ABD5Z201_9EURY|nr:PLP-dependent aspartate aminotransferase family protein [Halospeciosus flavus]